MVLLPRPVVQSSLVCYHPSLQHKAFFLRRSSHHISAPHYSIPHRPKCEGIYLPFFFCYHGGLFGGILLCLLEALRSNSTIYSISHSDRAQQSDTRSPSSGGRPLRCINLHRCLTLSFSSLFSVSTYAFCKIGHKHSYLRSHPKIRSAAQRYFTLRQGLLRDLSLWYRSKGGKHESMTLWHSDLCHSCGVG
jgi:hypothetical protein